MTSTVAAPSAQLVLAALDGVRDPELDEPITSLEFVASCVVSEDGSGGFSAEVHLRLPTYFCAPNFAFLMVADAFDAVNAVPGVRQTVIVLDDHFASDAINAGVAARAGFVESMGADLAAGELDPLRRDFLRKAVLAGTDRVCRPLLGLGTTPDQLGELTLGDLPRSTDLERLRQRRQELGLPSADGAALLIDPATGERIEPDGLRLHLGKARLSRVNIEANGSMCRGMLHSRYGIASRPEEEDR